MDFIDAEPFFASVLASSSSVAQREPVVMIIAGIHVPSVQNTNTIMADQNAPQNFASLKQRTL